MLVLAHAVYIALGSLEGILQDELLLLALQSPWMSKAGAAQAVY